MKLRRKEDGSILIIVLTVVVIFAVAAAIAIPLSARHAHIERDKRIRGFRVNTVEVEANVCSFTYNDAAAAVPADGMPWGCARPNGFSVPDILGYCRHEKGSNAVLRQIDNGDVYCGTKR